MPQLNKFDIEMFAKRAAQELLEHDRDMNESIFEIASVHSLNRDQIRRVVESANTIANGELVKRAKATGSDPRVSFKLADSSAIFTRGIDESPAAKAVQLNQTEKLASMFVVPDPVRPLEKMADVASDPRLSDMTGMELAQAYACGQDVSKNAFTCAQLSEAVIELDRTRDAARVKWAQLASLEDDCLERFAVAVESEMHAGLSPATIKSAAARAPVLPEHMDIARMIIDAKARDLGRDNGQDKIAAETIVDERSPVVTELCALMLIDAERDAMLTAYAKLADAHARAHADMTKAAAAGPHKVAVNLATVQQSARNLGQNVKGVAGGAFKAVGVGLGTVEAANRARAATNRLKRMQSTPAVGPMKMAAEKLANTGGGFVETLRSLKPTPGGLAAIALAGGVASAGAAGAGKLIDLAGKGVSSIFERRRRDKLFEQLLQRDPALKREARAREYFDLVLTYAPALGDHPTAIGDFLKRQLQYPVSSVEFLAAIAKLQKDVSEARRQHPSPFTAGIGEAVHGAQSQWLKN